jgi:hypothetical protein
MSERVFSVTTGRAAHRFRAQRCEYTRELYTLFLTRFWLPVSPACLLRLAVSSTRPSLRSNRSTRLQPFRISRRSERRCQ